MFQRLKEWFAATLALIVPDPWWQFVVEVDASSESIGAVLSQRSAKDNRMHPCVYLSRKLSPAEKNYDVRNKELLAVKVALEEWRHWLEGAEQPFLVCMDNKNLENIKKAKRLNSCQDICTLFFLAGLTLHYRFDQANKMLNLMRSCQRTWNHTSTELCGWSGVLANRIRCEAGKWGVQRLVGVHVTVCLFLCHYVLRQSTGLTHPCSHAIQELSAPYLSLSSRSGGQLWRRKCQHVAACPVCARNKTSPRAQTNLLQPLAVPHWPWSHIFMVFVTGLPPSRGNTTILTAVDHFSKMALCSSAQVTLCQGDSKGHDELRQRSTAHLHLLAGVLAVKFANFSHVHI